MIYALRAVNRGVISKHASAYAAGVAAREYDEWLRRAGFRRSALSVTCDGRRVGNTSPDGVAFAAGRAGLAEPVRAKPRRRLSKARVVRRRAA